MIKDEKHELDTIYMYINAYVNLYTYTYIRIIYLYSILVWSVQKLAIYNSLTLKIKSGGKKLNNFEGEENRYKYKLMTRLQFQVDINRKLLFIIILLLKFKTLDTFPLPKNTKHQTISVAFGHSVSIST